MTGNKNGKDDKSSLPLEILNIGVFNTWKLRLSTFTREIWIDCTSSERYILNQIFVLVQIILQVMVIYSYLKL